MLKTVNIGCLFNHVFIYLLKLFLVLGALFFVLPLSTGVQRAPKPFPLILKYFEN